MNINRFLLHWIRVSGCKTQANNSNLIKRFCSSLLVLLFFTTAIIAQDPCDIDCIAQVNLSLDQNCEATVLPTLLGAETGSGISLTLRDEVNNLLPSNTVGLEYVDQNLTYHMTNSCGNQCWGNVLIEYKLAPQINCPSDLTLTCNGLDALALPVATGQCGGGSFEVILLNEEREALTCDPDYTHIVKRTYRATNSFGNSTDCSHTITLERVDLTAVNFPEDASISCNDPNHVFVDGVPIPWLSGSPFTGSGTAMIPASGVPFICDPSVTAGVFCPLTGSGSGAPLIPKGGATIVTPDGVVIVDGTGEGLCNSAILFTDTEVPGTACVKKVIRQWEVREWWCNGENSVGDLQLIEIIDDAAPEFTCPADFTVNVDDNCIGPANFPALNVVDACDNGAEVKINTGVGIFDGNGGTYDLPVGENIVTYIVNDDCDNSATCSVNVTVSDSVEPVAICDQNMVVSLAGTSDTYVFANALDDGSWDECGIQEYLVRRMTTECLATDDLTFDDKVQFCCADSGNEVMVVFRVVDISGNFNDCMVRVEVQDKVDPTLTCPKDVFLDCRDSYDVNDLDASFGNPSQMDFCGNPELINETPTINVNQCGIGEIERLFTLTNSSTGDIISSCKQFITITNNTPFGMADITWPIDHTVTNSCGNANAFPQDLPTVSSFPTYVNNDNCSLLGYDYEDNFVASSVPGQCGIIQRTWTVLNWCSQVNGSFERFIIPSPQIITIENSTAPVINADPGIEITSQNINCESALVEITKTAIDDCSLSDLKWSYRIDTDPPSTLPVASGNTNEFSGSLQNGDYNISWRVEDACGNFDFENQSLSISSSKAPVPVCLNGLQKRLLTNNELELWASDFDAGSYQSCGNTVTVSFSPNTSDTNITYTCGNVGMNDVTLYVTDLVTGQSDYCLTNIQILDSGNCTSINSNMNIKGEVITENFESIEDVEVYLGNTNEMSITSADGEYAFPEMPMGGSYDIQPVKDKNYLEGVSTLDLVLIQRHILGLQTLEGPYKRIAADVDNNETITALDLIVLRKLILGVTQDLETNTSWRFVDSEYRFLDPINPWLSDFPETYEIQDLQSDMDIDFIGVKIGDVNNSIISNLNNQNLNERSSRWPLKFNVELTTEPDGNQKATFYSDSYERISGWQATLEFDQDIEIIDIQGKAIPMNEENYALNFIEDGLLPISYHSPSTLDIQTGEALFEIRFRNNGDINSQLSMTSKITEAEAYRGYNELVDIVLENKIPNAKLLEIVSANPNPWTDATTIDFNMPKEGFAKWEFFDVNGKVIHTRIGDYQSGQNSLRIDRTDLNITGIVYVKLTTDQTSTKYKMIIVK